MQSSSTRGTWIEITIYLRVNDTSNFVVLHTGDVD